MKVHEKIRSCRREKGWSQEDMAEKLDLSVNGYANIERGETDVQLSRLEKIAETFGIELLELFNWGEKTVFYVVNNNSQLSCYSNQEHNQNHFEMTDLSSEKKELQHELEKTRLIVTQQEKEIAYLNEIISLLKKE
ncbi:MAG: XRE family transcriptional regulator [Candidatus Parabeggiatoa sp. nov. 3]|nr:MAG: XRE family transcriptional regulator [Gammaproteobacteria bacterium]